MVKVGPPDDSKKLRDVLDAIGASIDKSTGEIDHAKMKALFEAMARRNMEQKFRQEYDYRSRMTKTKDEYGTRINKSKPSKIVKRLDDDSYDVMEDIYFYNNNMAKILRNMPTGSGKVILQSTPNTQNILKPRQAAVRIESIDLDKFNGGLEESPLKGDW